MVSLWEDIQQFFPFLQNNPSIIYVDNAATTQKPQDVIDAMDNYIAASYANIHRGVYSLAERSELLYQGSKKKVSHIIWWDPREIIYTYNATYASNILAQSLVISKSLKQWDTVLLGIRDHHATIVAWQLLAQQFGFQIAYIPIDVVSLDIDWNALQLLLTSHRVRVIVCSHVSNVTGIIYDIKHLHTILSEYIWTESREIFLAIDGSQAVPHMKVDVKDLWCDAYFFTWHKMMGPTGIGVLWIEKMQARSLQTLFGWGGIIESVTTDWCSLIRTADKFEPWTPNLIWAIGLWAACDFYNKYDIYANIWSYENYLCGILIDWLQNFKDITVIWQHSHMNKCGIVSLVVDHPIELSEYLASQNICVRAWGHCAHPLLHYLGQDRGVVRISVFVYTTLDDITKILAVINNFVHI